jgi:hypothetical protein
MKAPIRLDPPRPWGAAAAPKPARKAQPKPTRGELIARQWGWLPKEGR